MCHQFDFFIGGVYHINFEHLLKFKEKLKKHYAAYLNRHNRQRKPNYKITRNTVYVIDFVFIIQAK